MKNTKRKGFTIVELVIVIAVIAILAAVLIPTFSNLVEKASISADTQLVKNMNTALSIAEAEDGKNKTMGDALDDVYAAGYTVDKLTPTSEGYLICWDQETDRMVFLKSDKSFYYSESSKDSYNSALLWMVVHTAAELDASKADYSIYLAADYSGATDTITVANGFDCGDIGVQNVVLSNTASTLNYILNTVGSNVTINMPTATITHYGNAGNVVVEAINNASYHCRAAVSVLELQIGNAVIEPEAAVNALIIAPKGEIKSAEEIIIQDVSVSGTGLILSKVTSDKNIVVSESAPSKEVVKLQLKAKMEEKVTVKENAGAAPEITSISVKTAADLKGTDGLYVLDADIALAETLTVTGNVILDLNGKTLTLSSSKVDENSITSTVIVINSGSLIINDSAGTGKITHTNAVAESITATNAGKFILNNGTIEIKSAGYKVWIYNTTTEKADDKIVVGYAPVVLVIKGSSATINGGSISNVLNSGNHDDYAGPCITVKGSASTVTVNNGQLIGYDGGAIMGNGTAGNEGTVVNINGGKLIGHCPVGNDGLAIYQPQHGVLNITGGYIEGDDGINIKSGTVNISGGTIKATAAHVSDLETRDNTNGSVATGAALAITSNSAYAGNMTVKVTGGEFISAKGYAIYELIPFSTKDNPPKPTAAATSVNSIELIGGTYTHGSDVSNDIFIKEAFNKITVSGITATIKYGNK